MRIEGLRNTRFRGMIHFITYVSLLMIKMVINTCMYQYHGYCEAYPGGVTREFNQIEALVIEAKVDMSIALSMT